MQPGEGLLLQLFKHHQTDLLFIRAEQIDVVVLLLFFCRSGAAGRVLHTSRTILTQRLLHSWQAEVVK